MSAKWVAAYPPFDKPEARRALLSVVEVVEPRKEMVRNRREGEPGLLGTDRIADQGGAK